MSTLFAAAALFAARVNPNSPDFKAGQLLCSLFIPAVLIYLCICYRFVRYVTLIMLILYILCVFSIVFLGVRPEKTAKPASEHRSSQSGSQYARNWLEADDVHGVPERWPAQQ